ncbi:SRPBCC family protein, partial [Spelaeicoccus albus]
MKIADTATLHASPPDVFDALQDPKVLAASIPGVQTLDRVSDDHYTATIVAGVAAIKGSFTGEVTLSEQSRPDSFVMTASGAGAPGTVKAIVTVRLAPTDDGGTTLTYEADAVVGGMVGGVGQRMITGVAKKMAGVFFTTVDEVIEGGIPDMPAPGDTASGAAEAAAPDDRALQTQGVHARGPAAMPAVTGAASERGFAAG